MATAMIDPVLLDSMKDFLEMVQGGVGPKNAAVACGWTLRQLAELEANPQFQEAMAATLERRTESIEERVVKLALRDNVPMIQLYLYCQAADRGWRPPTQRVAVQHGGTVVVEKIQATKAALLEIMRENGVKTLALGGPLDGDIVEAEVVDGGQ
jgi:hypothetical protein